MGLDVDVDPGVTCCGRKRLEVRPDEPELGRVVEEPALFRGPFAN